MFRSARLKLTAWYLLIIMLISVSFSAVIYVGVSRELERGFRRAEIRYRAKELGIPIPRHWQRHLENLDPRLRSLGPSFFTTEELEETRRSVGFSLLIINGVILLFSAGAGYFLSGKTLAPIKGAMEEQKRFVADASHELRTPLTALKTSMEVALRDKKLSVKEAKRAILSNLEDVENLQFLAGGLLSLAHYQGNGKSFRFNEIDLGSVIKKAYNKIL